MDLNLAFRLCGNVFSTDRQNMRYFNRRRILMAGVIIPSFMFLFIVNRLFLFLDHILFPAFKKHKVRNPVYIISAPRSATTFLFHILAENDAQFTTFRLWEIIFAPSVCQKHIASFISYCDRHTGNFIRKTLGYLENKILGDFGTIHKMSLFHPEEDEAILLWNLSTCYLNFFFPDTFLFEDYFFFDLSMPENKRRRIMRFYENCIRRHNYFFNRSGEKRFLSKNPAFMAKTGSLYEIFPDAQILNINRCPAKSIPSTLALNENIYRHFTSIKAGRSISERTEKILVKWYTMSYESFKTFFPGQTLYIDFKNLVNNDQQEISRIEEFLKMKSGNISWAMNTSQKKEDHINNNKYRPMKESELESALNEMPFLKKYCEELDTDSFIDKTANKQ